MFMLHFLKHSIPFSLSLYKLHWVFHQLYIFQCPLFDQAVLSYMLDQTVDTEIIDEIPNEVDKERVKKVCCV